MLTHVRQGRGVYFQEESFSVFKKDLKEYLDQWKHGLKNVPIENLLSLWRGWIIGRWISKMQFY